MPLAVRTGDALATGHDCDDATVLAAPSQSTVFAESKLWARLGDATIVHEILEGIVCVDHTEVIKGSSATVFVVGIKCARLGDAVDAGAMIGSAATVYAG